MAEKIFDARLKLKYDSFDRWQSSDLVLNAGEPAVATIPLDTGAVQGEPAVVIKVGDGKKSFKELPLIAARAADVYSWAKAESKPSYGAEEITGIDSYIASYVNDQMGISVDTDTQYQLVKVDDYTYKLQQKGKLDAAWADVAGSVINIPNQTDAIKALETLVGSTSVAQQITSAIAALDLANTYEIKGAAATALEQAKAYADTKDADIAAAKKAGTDAQANLTAYETANDAALAAETKRATEAEQANAQAAKDAKAAADAVAAKVGTVPEESTVMEIIENIQKNAYDDTEIRSLVKGNTDAIAAEKERASGVESGLENRLAAVEGDYLKSADKTELQAAVDTQKGRVDTLIGEDAGKSARTIANEELAARLIADDAAESMDTLEEIAKWIQDHPNDAAAMNRAIEALQAKVDTGDKNVSVYVSDAIAALNIGNYALAADLTALASRVSALEAKAQAWDASEQNAKDYADTLNTAMDKRVASVEKEKANTADLAAVATSGLIDDLSLGEGTVLVFNCGDSTTVI